MDISFLYTKLIEFISENQFASGGIFIGIVTGLLYSLKPIPFRIINFLHSRLYINLRIDSKNELFKIIKTYFAKYNVALFCRHFNADLVDNDISLSLDSGKRYWFFCKRRLLSVEFERVEKEHNILERYYLRIYTRKKSIAFNILKHIASLAKEDFNYVKLYNQDYDYMSLMAAIEPVYENTLFLANNLFEFLINDLKKFQESSQEYVNRGIRYKRGYLFYGPPGNGKSKTIIALATALHKSICTINVATSLKSLIASIYDAPKNSILVVEDIDKFLEGKHDEDQYNDSDLPSYKDRASPKIIGNLLNILDGPYTRSGQIVIFTTNYPEKVEPALLRAGRMDVKVLFDNPDKDQCRKMFKLFFKSVDSSIENDIITKLVDDNRSMAEVQELMLKYDNNLNGLCQELNISLVVDIVN